MNKRFCIAAVSALFFLVAANPPRAQDQGGRQANNSSYKLSVGANMVLVPVVVTDKHGQHVSGLKAEDFEVQEEGKTQKIAAFDEVIAETAAVPLVALLPNSFSNRVIAKNPKKLEILLLDLLNTPLSGRAEARRGLIEFLSKSADPDTLVALLVLRKGGVRMIHNFTTDPSVLVAAIQQVQAPVASRDNPTLNTNAEMWMRRRSNFGPFSPDRRPRRLSARIPHPRRWSLCSAKTRRW